jgi:hypothetical protein
MNLKINYYIKKSKPSIYLHIMCVKFHTNGNSTHYVKELLERISIGLILI